MSKDEQEKLLAEWRKCVLKRTPLKERLDVLRKLIDISDIRNEWIKDLAEHEKERLLEIENSIEYDKTLKDDNALTDELNALNKRVQEREFLDNVEKKINLYSTSYSPHELINEYKSVITTLKDRKWEVYDVTELEKKLKRDLVATLISIAQNRIDKIRQKIDSYPAIDFASNSDKDINRKENFLRKTIDEILKENSKPVYRHKSVSKQIDDLYNYAIQNLQDFLIKQDEHFYDTLITGIDPDKLKNVDQNKLDEILKVIMNHQWRSNDNPSFLSKINACKNKINSEFVRRKIEADKKEQTEEEKKRAEFEKHYRESVLAKIQEIINIQRNMKELLVNNNKNAALLATEQNKNFIEMKKKYEELCIICDRKNIYKYLKIQDWVPSDSTLAIKRTNKLLRLHLISNATVWCLIGIIALSLLVSGNIIYAIIGDVIFFIIAAIIGIILESLIRKLLNQL
ncbi:MAG: hypothetical protein LBB88_10645 [Planctomycetaceae bacterium]|jgi:hypothetical protein|nr:hypothetical protein [Planctomycetaceae bacterium]